MHFGIGAPNVASFADPIRLVELAVASEEAGWDGFFLWDHLFFDTPAPGAVEPWTVLAAVAAATSRVRIGVLVTALARRRPELFAQQVATVDLLSRGRVVVGVGLGSRADEFASFGQDAGTGARARVLEEALDVVCRLWSGAAVRHEGHTFSVDAPPLLPRPHQQPRPPVWVGGRWPGTAPFRRAARYDGVMPLFADNPGGGGIPPSDLHDAVAFVQAHRVDDGPFDVVVEGETTGAGQLADLAALYGGLGCTWWVERAGWWRGGWDGALRRVRLGPPEL